MASGLDVEVGRRRRRLLEDEIRERRQILARVGQERERVALAPRGVDHGEVELLVRGAQRDEQIEGVVDRALGITARAIDLVDHQDRRRPRASIDRFGADTFRCYLMFIGPWSDGGPYRPEGINGVSRWLNRVWTVAMEPYSQQAVDEDAERELVRLRHVTVLAVSEDIESFRFNTMIPRLMDFTTALLRANETGNVTRAVYDEAVETLLLMIAPSAPHIAEELWARTGTSTACTGSRGRRQRRRRQRRDLHAGGTGQRQGARQVRRVR